MNWRAWVRDVRGVSLPFLAMALTAGAIAGAGMMGSGNTNRARYAEKMTRDHIETIRDALQIYYTANTKYPCPADPAAGEASASFGTEVAGCDTTCPLTGTSVSCSGLHAAVAGAVPTRVLKIPDKYAYDGWGRRITYVVDKNAAVTTIVTNSLTVQDVYGNNLTDGSNRLVPFMLFSHGATGKGGWVGDGSAQIACAGTGEKDHENCDADAIFVAQPTRPDSSIIYDDFADIGGLGVAQAQGGGGEGDPTLDGCSTATHEYVLDAVSNADYAFSFRKLRSAYTGAAVRVRRTSDSTESDITWDENGDLCDPLLTFCAATDCYVTQWYNQGALTTFHLIQTNTAYQPQIVDSGALITNTHRDLAMKLDGNLDGLYSSPSWAYKTAYANLTIAAVGESLSTSAPGGTVGLPWTGFLRAYNNNGVSRYVYTTRKSNNTLQGYNYSAWTSEYVHTDIALKPILDFKSIDTSTGTQYINDTVVSTSSTANYQYHRTYLLIGSTDAGQYTNRDYGVISEYIAWRSTLSSGNASSARDNIMTHYGLLPCPTTKAEAYLLDAVGNADYAFSLRQLRNAYSDAAIQVRRTSDSTEKNIGFDKRGDICPQLTKFCADTNCYVSAWYNQGSQSTRHLTQDTTSYQPQITSSGTVVTNGSGQVAMDVSGLQQLTSGNITGISKSQQVTFASVGQAASISAPGSTGQAGWSGYGSTNRGSFWLKRYAGTNKFQHRDWSGWTDDIDSEKFTVKPLMSYATVNGSSSTLHFNEELLHSGSGHSTGTITSLQLNAGAGATQDAGDISEMVWWFSLPNSTNARANIMAHYGLYECPSTQTHEKVLDTAAGNADYAFSFRKLRAAYTGPGIRVRRTSDSTERDIAFDAYGNICPDLMRFCAETDCYVRTWYNQGALTSFHLIQTNTAYQPQIVASGVPISNSHGDLAMKLDGNLDGLYSSPSWAYKTAYANLTIAAVGESLSTSAPTGTVGLPWTGFFRAYNNNGVSRYVYTVRKSNNDLQGYNYSAWTADDLIQPNLRLIDPQVGLKPMLDFKLIDTTTGTQYINDTVVGTSSTANYQYHRTYLLIGSTDAGQYTNRDYGVISEYIAWRSTLSSGNSSTVRDNLLTHYGLLSCPSTAAENYLLDDVDVGNADYAYSLRKLRAAYDGAALRVRRTSDSKESDIGFDNNNDVCPDLTQFCADTDCHVIKWYNQGSATDADLVQLTAGNQPGIVSTGTPVEDSHNNLAVSFDGTNDTLSHSASGSTNLSPVTVTSVGESGAATVGSSKNASWLPYISNGDNSIDYYRNISYPTYYLQTRFNSTAYDSEPYTDTTDEPLGQKPSLYTFKRSHTAPANYSYNWYRNGVAAASSTHNTGSAYHTGSSLLLRLGNSTAYDLGKTSEFILWSTNTPTLSDVHADTQQHYGLPDLNCSTTKTHAYVLDAVGNADYAFSLRRLRAAYTGPALRVRRTSDSAEKNVEFDDNGDLCPSLMKFCWGTDCYVTQWYNQGALPSFNLRQPNTAYQPQIVASGAPITNSHGDLAMKLDGNLDGFYSYPSWAYKTAYANLTIAAVGESLSTSAPTGTVGLAWTGFFRAYNNNGVSRYVYTVRKTNNDLQGYNYSAWTADDLIQPSLRLIDPRLGNKPMLDFKLIDTSTGTQYINDTVVGTSSTANYQYHRTYLLIGSTDAGQYTNRDYGVISEYIAWRSTLSGSNATTARDNIITHYGLLSCPATTSDDYLFGLTGVGDADYAYSLRKLKSGYTDPALRVRRASDSVESYLRFDANDDLCPALTKFCADTDCYVKTWHNQGTGANGDLYQGTLSQQPQIVTSGTPNTDTHGNLAISISGTQNLSMPNITGLNKAQLATITAVGEAASATAPGSTEYSPWAGGYLNTSSGTSLAYRYATNKLRMNLWEEWTGDVWIDELGTAPYLYMSVINNTTGAFYLNDLQRHYTTALTPQNFTTAQIQMGQSSGQNAGDVSEYVAWFGAPTLATTRDDIMKHYGLGRTCRSTSAASPYVLDTSAGNADYAFSLRRLRAGYTGPALRVRRTSDSAERNITFDATGDLCPSLMKFCWGTDCYVTQWYNQGALPSFNLRQPNTAYQPQIVASGAPITNSHGDLSMKLDGNLDGFYSHPSWAYKTAYANLTIAAVGESLSTSAPTGTVGLAWTGFLRAYNNNGVSRYVYTVRKTNNDLQGYNYSAWTADDLIQPSLRLIDPRLGNKPMLDFKLIDTSTGTQYINDTVVGTSSTANYQYHRTYLLIGSTDAGQYTNRDYGVISEYIAWRSTLSGSNASTARSNILTHYGLLSCPDTHPDAYLLDTVGNAEYAYSLRKLWANYARPGLKVRRSSDSDDTDLYFDADGSICSDLMQFCAGTDCYVNTWYNQGSTGETGDLVQEDAAKQPQIVSSGTAVEDTYGNLAVRITGTQTLDTGSMTGLSQNQEITVVTVGEADSTLAPTGTEYSPWAGASLTTNSGSSLAYRYTTNKLKMNLWEEWTSEIAPTDIGDEPHLHMSVIDDSDGTYYINSTSKYTTSSLTSATITSAQIKMGVDTGQNAGKVSEYVAWMALPNVSSTQNNVLKHHGLHETSECSSTETGSYILDVISNADYAFSFRKLRAAYTGPAFRVRRTSDSTERNIEFDANNDVCASLMKFCRGTDCYVTQWYNQGALPSFNLRQPNTAYQPQIVSSGVPITNSHGDLAMKLDGNLDGFYSHPSWAYKTAYANLTIAAVGESLSTSAPTGTVGLAWTGFLRAYNNNGVSRYVYTVRKSNNNLQGYNYSAWTSEYSHTDIGTKPILDFKLINTSTGTQYINDTVVGTSSTANYQYHRTYLLIGSTDAGQYTNRDYGVISEYIAWRSTLSTGNATTARGNIISHYQLLEVVCDPDPPYTDYSPTNSSTVIRKYWTSGSSWVGCLDP